MARTFPALILGTLLVTLAGSLLSAQEVEVEVEILEGHEHPLRSLVFSADGKTLFSSSEDTKILAWDLKKKRPKVVDEDHGYATVLSLKPDGKTLVSASFDHAVRFWDTKRLRLVRKINEDGKIIADLAWHPEGDCLVGGSAEWIHIWEGKDGKLRREFRAHDNWVTAVAVSPDGKRLASGGYDKAIHLWDMTTGEKIKSASESRMGMIFALAWYPEGRDLIIAGQGTSFVRWNSETNESSTLFRGHEDVVKEVAFSPNGKLLASASKDRTVRIWAPDTGKLLATWKGHEQEINCLSWSADGKRIASGDRANKIRIWSLPKELLERD